MYLWVLDSIFYIRFLGFWIKSFPMFSQRMSQKSFTFRVLLRKMGNKPNVSKGQRLGGKCTDPLWVG